MSDRGGDDFPPLPDFGPNEPEWGGADDDPFNDAWNFDLPNIDERIFGFEGFESDIDQWEYLSETDRWDEVTDEDFLRDAGILPDEDEDDYDDDIDPETGQPLDNEDDEDEDDYDDDDDYPWWWDYWAGDAPPSNLKQEGLRGPFPTSDALLEYLNEFNGWRFLTAIYGGGRTGWYAYIEDSP